MIPTYLKHCTPDMVTQWHKIRNEALDNMSYSLLLLPHYLWYRFIQTGKLPY